MMVPMTASLIAPMASSWIQPFAFSLTNAITGKRVTRAKHGQEGVIFLFLPALLLLKILGKGVTKAGKGYISMN